MGNLKEYFANAGVRFQIVHTSGHAKLSDIKKIVEALNPEIIIPIHSLYAEKFQKYFPKTNFPNQYPEIGFFRSFQGNIISTIMITEI